ncbi:MAG TPA: hypothetical protein VLJ57_07370 [Burkholderiaceae bacterium]|nr:hypothetical protein [Burkholderiaceae bacterium]
MSFVLEARCFVSHAVKISDTEMKAVREAAAINSRSIAGQAEHWIRLGRAVERNPEFGYVKVERALKGLESVDDLSDNEQEMFLDGLSSRMKTPGPDEDAFWADRQKRGLGVGMDNSGNPVYGAQAIKKPAL